MNQETFFYSYPFMKLPQICVSILLILLSSACDLFSPHKEVSLDVPHCPMELQPSYEGLWVLELRSLSGDSQISELDWSEGIAERITVEWPKEEELLALLYPPEWEPGLGPDPWGSYVSPISQKGIFGFKAGAAVSVMMKVLEAGGELKGVNCRRFLDEMDALDDPWMTDQELLVRQLGRREMRSWYIRPRRLFPLILPLPQGTWFFSSLLHLPLISDGNGSELSLPEGYSLLFHPETGCLAEIQVDDHGVAVWMLRIF